MASRAARKYIESCQRACEPIRLSLTGCLSVSFTRCLSHKLSHSSFSVSLTLSHSLSASFSLTHSFSLSHSCSFLTRFPRLSLQSLCLIDLVSLTLGLRLLSALVFSLSLTLTSLVSLAFVLSLSPSFSLSLSQLSLSVTRSLSYFPTLVLS